MWKCVVAIYYLDHPVYEWRNVIWLMSFLNLLALMAHVVCRKAHNPVSPWGHYPLQITLLLIKICIPVICARGKSTMFEICFFPWPKKKKKKICFFRPKKKNLFLIMDVFSSVYFYRKNNFYKKGRNFGHMHTPRRGDRTSGLWPHGESNSCPLRVWLLSEAMIDNWSTASATQFVNSCKYQKYYKLSLSWAFDFFCKWHVGWE